MAKSINRLTAKAVEKKTAAGLFHDGLGLYLQVSTGGAKSWLLRYALNGKPQWMGLGSYNDLSLEQARTQRDAKRGILKEGVDPIAAREAEQSKRQLAAARTMTFDHCADAYIKSHRAGWKNAKHTSQWTNTLKTYASPIFGGTPVQAIDTAAVMEVLEPIWTTKTETATRVRSRIELILDWAKARGLRSGENPALWRGHLDKLLPQRSKIQAVRNHLALPYPDAPHFMTNLRERTGVAAKAVEYLILTAARVSEAVNATWAEVDTEKRVWTIPAARMKANREHRVPLSDAALAVLRAMQAQRQSDYLFPGWKIKRPITGAACLKLLRDGGLSELTVHGFRSTFRDWCAEQTNYPRDVCEMALAHTIKDKAEAAYRRGDLLEKRARLMDDWAKYLAQPRAASVTPIRKQKR